MMYGVCKFDVDYDDKPKHLVKFETYEEARIYYIKEYVMHKHYIDDDIWIVYIDSNNTIVQFDQLIPHVKTKIVQL